MKKLFALVLAVVMVLSMAACAETTKAMTYAEYEAAAVEAAVTVECYVQGNQSWWFDSDAGHGKITVYAQDNDGAYFLYEMKCSEEDAKKLTPGTKILVTGFKAEWEGEVEIIDCSFEFVKNAKPMVAEALDATALLASEDLIKHQNKKVAFKGMTVEASNDAGAAFLYRWDGSGEEGDDLYFKASVNGATYTFCIESYLTGADTDVYKAVKALKVGDKIDMEGFLYWYQGVQPHITAVTAAN